MDNNQAMEEIKLKLIEILENNKKQAEEKIAIVEKQIEKLKNNIPYDDENMATFEKRLAKLCGERDAISDKLLDIKGNKLTKEELEQIEQGVTSKEIEQPEKTAEMEKNTSRDDKKDEEPKNEETKEISEDGKVEEITKNADGTKEKTKRFSDNLAEVANNYSSGINKSQKGRTLEILKDSMKEGVETYTVTVMAYKEVTEVGQDGKETTRVERDPENDNETFGRVNWETGESTSRTTGSVINDRGEVTQNYETKTGSINPANLRSQTETFQLAEGKPTPLGSTLEPERDKNIVTIKNGVQTLFQIEQDASGATITLYDKEGNPTDSKISFGPDGKLVGQNIEPEMEEIAQAIKGVSEVPTNICEGTADINQELADEVVEVQKENENEEIETENETNSEEIEEDPLKMLLDGYKEAVIGTAAIEVAETVLGAHDMDERNNQEDEEE